MKSDQTRQMIRMLGRHGYSLIRSATTASVTPPPVPTTPVKKPLGQTTVFKPSSTEVIEPVATKEIKKPLPPREPEPKFSWKDFVMAMKKEMKEHEDRLRAVFDKDMPAETVVHKAVRAVLEAKYEHPFKDQKVTPERVLVEFVSQLQLMDILTEEQVNAARELAYDFKLLRTELDKAA